MWPMDAYSTRPAGRAATSNPAAVAGFAAGLVTLVIGLLWTMARPTVRLMLGGDEIAAIVGTEAVATLVVMLASIVALVLGLVGLRRQAKRARAGIAIGIAMFAALSSVFTFAGMFVSGVA